MKTISVLEKREWNWKPKDKEERTVPIPDSLMELLKVRKAMHADGWLIFPNTKGNPEGHFLRMLKERALAAGLNCGHCMGTLDGKAVSCKDAACCEHWILHRFRKTFATMHHANGVPVRTIQLWLGHESLRYGSDAITPPNPEPRAMREHLVVPSIGSREVVEALPKPCVPQSPRRSARIARREHSDAIHRYQRPRSH